MGENRVLGAATERPLRTALITYVALRGTCLAVVAVWAAHLHRHLLTVLAGRFDAADYIHIAQHGYTTKTLAFFPLFPLLIRAASFLPISAAAAAVAIAWAGSLAAAAGMFKVGEHVHGRRAGLMLVALWAVLPHALVESMAYTEGLFTAFAAWSLYFVLRERWLAAGLFCAIGSFTRPTGVALIGALLATAIVHGVRHRQARPLLAPLVGCTGWLAYISWVGVRLGRADGWFWVQRTYWHSHFDGGRMNLHLLGEALVGRRISIVFYVVTAVVLVAVLLLILSISSRQPLPLVLYSAAVLALTLGSNTGPNKARLLIPAFTLLLPPAIALAKVRARDAVAIIGAGAVVSAWFGGYLALVWTWSP